MTTLTENAAGLNFTAPFTTSTTFTQQSSFGNWSGAYFTEQWTGTNLGYSAGAVNPTSGTLTSMVVTSPTTGAVIFSVTGANYNIASTDAGADPNQLALEMITNSQTPITEIGNSGNDSFVWYAGLSGGVANIIGTGNNESITFSHNFSNYTFSNYNAKAGSVTVTSTSAGISANISDVQKFIFADETLSFANLISSTTPTTTTTTTSPTTTTTTTSTSNAFSGPFTNYQFTPLYSGKNGAFSGFTVKDNVGNSGTSSINSSVQYLTFNSGQTSVTVQNLTSSSVTLSNDANVIAVDPTSGASITGGSGTDVIFGGPNDTIYGGKGTATAAFVEPYSNFTITPLYKGKNGAFSGFSVVDNLGSFGTTTINTAVKYLSFGGSGNGATLLTLGSNGTYSVSGSTSSPTSVTQGPVSTFLSSASSAATSSFSISDSNTNVASNIDALQQNSSKIKSITLTSSATNLPISYAQYSNDSSVLTDIVGAYSLNISAVTLANLSSVAQNAKVIGISLSDTAANIGSNIDSIQAQASKITSISQTDTSTPINISNAQFASDTKALSLITGSYSLNVSAVPVASFNSVIGTSTVNSVGITDTDANFVANLSVLNSNVNKISTITLTDSHVLAITQAQQTADSALLSKIVGGYTIATNSVTLAPSSTYTALSGQTITGVSGLNTVILNEPYSNFSSSISGTTDVIKDNSGSLGTITLNNIQRVKFSDGSEVALDFQSGQNSFNAAMMIGTAFGASMVPTYFGAAISLFDQGQTNSQIAGLIEQIGLIENQLNIANDNSASSNKTWVDFVYKNVVGSNPDPLSEAVYTSYLANGTLTRAQILTLAANAADASSGTIASQINLIGLQTKGLVFHSAF